MGDLTRPRTEGEAEREAGQGRSGGREGNGRRGGPWAGKTPGTPPLLPLPVRAAVGAGRAVAQAARSNAGR
ncbi:hypothetical protein GTU99_28105 [Streptomyces sp. PRKS01-65]|nr:hypothetical protein [Streptomyces harenosi]